MKKYRLIEHLKKSMTLIVSLTENNSHLALKLENAGAHAVKVHLNCIHRASKTDFRSWNEERESIGSIPANLSIPVGIVPGAETTSTLEEMREITDAGFDFLDIFSHHMPPEYYDIKELTKVTAVDYRFDLSRAYMLKELGTEVFESSIIPPQEYGMPLTADDIVKYKTLISGVAAPVFIPTQRKVKPEQVRYLHDAGASGIAIGAVVTTKDFDEILRVTEMFRKEVDKI